MKRPLIYTCVIGLVVTVLVGVAHMRGWLLPLESPLNAWAQRRGAASREIGNVAQFLCIALLAFGVAWLTLAITGRHRVAWLILAIAAELLALLWVCSLYGVLFQPLPCILGTVLSYAGAIGLLAWNSRPRKPVAVRAPAPESLPIPVPAPRPAPLAAMKIAPRAKPVPVPQPAPVEVPKLSAADIGFDGAPAAFETTVLICDLADKYDLAENNEPSAATDAVVKFCERASDLLVKAGAYLHRADGEGVVAFFGFPRPMPEHAEKAVRVAFDLAQDDSAKPSGSNGENAAGDGVHVGVSSGWVVAARAGVKRDVFVLGEAVELARRFCVANRFYGSRILIGPRTFEMADRTVVARPIDFLSGVTAQERHEIYEPLALVADAPAELLARRDSFWNGVVLYREKRWAEAYASFQQARGAGGEEDAPLNLYLRRLEPLALHFLESARE